MSFLKGIFSKDEQQQKAPAGAKPTTQPPAGRPAPPARPFPVGFSPSAASSNGSAKPTSTPTGQQQHQRGASYQHQPTVAAAPVTPTVQTNGDSGGGGDMFDLFDGLSLKVATPAHATEPTSVIQQNGHAQSNGGGEMNPQPTAGGGDDDMFSGLTVASTDAAISDEQQANGGGSLLNQLENGDSGVSRKASTAESSFSFVSETATEDPAPEESGPSSFSFMASSPTPVEEATPVSSGMPSRKASERSEVPTPSNAAVAASPTATTATSPQSTQQSPARSVASTPASSTRSATSAAPTFEQIHAQIDTTLTTYWNDMKNLNLTHSGMRTQQITLQTSLKTAQDDILSLETQQQHEIDAENYDAADLLNEQLDALKVRVTTIQAQLKASQNALDEHERNKSHLAKLTRNTIEQALNQYTALTKQYTFNMHTTITNETTLLEQKEDKLITDLERTRRNLAHTQTDIKGVEVEEEKITEQMKVDTRDMTEEHDVLKGQLTELEKERDHLRALLQAKEEEVAMCSQKIDVVVTNINTKRSSHQKKLGRITEKRTRLQQEQQQATQEEIALLQAKQVLEADFHRVAAQEKGSTKRLKKMQEEVAFVQGIVKNKLEPAMKSKEEVAAAGAAATPASASSSTDKELDELQTKLSKTGTDLDDARGQLSSLEQQIDTQSQLLASVNQRIPALEAEKNTAVATRDFKKAAQASKDVKTLQTQKTEVEAAMSDLRAKSVELNSQINQLTEAKHNLLARISSLQSDADKRRLIHFLKARLELQWKMKQVDVLLQKQRTEKEDEEALQAAEGTMSPSSAAIAAHQSATITSHHFVFLDSERLTYRIEEELLIKEIRQLKEAHEWARSKDIEEEAKKELDAERKAKGEPPLEEEVVVAKEEVVDTISEQRRKERALAAAAAEKVASKEDAAATPESPKKAEPTAESTTTVAEEPVAASTDAAAPSTEEEPVATTEEKQAEPEPEPEPQPQEPAGPTEEQIAEWRSKYAALGEEITAAEATLQTAIETEDFEKADELETEISGKRAEQAALTKTAQDAGVTLSE